MTTESIEHEKIKPELDYPRKCFLKKNLKMLNSSFKKNFSNGRMEEIDAFRDQFDEIKDIAEKLPFTDCSIEISRINRLVECNMTFHNGYFVNISKAPECSTVMCSIQKDNYLVCMGEDTANGCFNTIDKHLHADWK